MRYVWQKQSLREGMYSEKPRTYPKLHFGMCCFFGTGPRNSSLINKVPLNRA